MFTFNIEMKQSYPLYERLTTRHFRIFHLGILIVVELLEIVQSPDDPLLASDFFDGIHQEIINRLVDLLGVSVITTVTTELEELDDSGNE